jgi:predicted Zn-dependent peptidase
MKHLRVLSALAAVLLALPILAVDAQDMDVQEIELENGMTVISVRRPETPRVFCSLFFNVGGVNETAGKTGLAHMLEHIMFKGTKVMGTKDFEKDFAVMKQIDEVSARIYELEKIVVTSTRAGREVPTEVSTELESLNAKRMELLDEQRQFMNKEELWGRYMQAGGTGLNASTGRDTTQYYVELPSNKLELFFWLETDRMANPIMREFYPERDVVIEERRMRIESTPTGRIFEAFNSLFYEAHPYRNPIIGWPSDLNNLQREDAIEFFNTYYAPNNCVAVLVGDLDHANVKSLTERYFSTLKRGKTEPPIIATFDPKPVAEKRMHAEADTDDSLYLEWPTVPNLHPDMYALDMLAEVLSGRSGRLYKDLVETKQIALGAGASQSNQRYAGGFYLSAQPKPGNHQACEEALVATLWSLKENPPTDQELQAAKNQYAASLIDQLRDNQNIAFMLARLELAGDWSNVEGIVERYNKVTREEILDVLDRYFAPEAKTVLWIKRKAKEEAAPQTTDPSGKE